MTALTEFIFAGFQFSPDFANFCQICANWFSRKQLEQSQFAKFAKINSRRSTLPTKSVAFYSIFLEGLHMRLLIFILKGQLNHEKKLPKYVDHCQLKGKFIEKTDNRCD